MRNYSHNSLNKVETEILNIEANIDLSDENLALLGQKFDELKYLYEKN